MNFDKVPPKKIEIIEKNDQKLAACNLNLSNIDKYGGVQKFVLAELEGKMYIESIDSNHLGIFEAMKKRYGEEIKSLGGGFLSVDPYENNLVILDQQSYKLGPLLLGVLEIKNLLENQKTNGLKSLANLNIKTEAELENF